MSDDLRNALKKIVERTTKYFEQRNMDLGGW